MATTAPPTLDQQVGLPLGAQADARVRAVTEAAFGRLRRVAETPFTLVHQARPSPAGG
jgi:hypothetical protein